MEKPYLIQRMKFKDITGSFDETFSLDYMGSSEFEFGSLPKSLKRITKRCDELSLNFFKKVKNHKGQALCVVATENDASEYVDNYIPGIADNSTRLKEASRLKDQIDGVDWRGEAITDYWRVDAWWDIVNDVIFTFGKNNAKRALKAIKNTRDKKRKAKESGWY